MPINPRAVVSWGQFPSTVVTTKMPYVATWGLMESLNGAAGLFNWLKSWYWWNNPYQQ
jgi:hypothetical protein